MHARSKHSEKRGLWHLKRLVFYVGRFANNQEITSGSSSSINGLTTSTTMPRWWDCSVSLMSLPAHLYLHLVFDNVILLQKHVNNIQIWTNCFRNISDFFFSFCLDKWDWIFLVISNFIHYTFSWCCEICLFSYIYNKINFKLYLILISLLRSSRWPDQRLQRKELEDKNSKSLYLNK